MFTKEKRKRMFCFQCQETMKNEGCQHAKGFCGKPAKTADLQDLLIYTLKGISLLVEDKELSDEELKELGGFLAESLFVTITNANFSDEMIINNIKSAVQYRDKLKKLSSTNTSFMHDSVNWSYDSDEDILEKSKNVGVLDTKDEDARSLRELLTYGIKGLSAYTDHAAVLNFHNNEIYKFIIRGLASTTKDLEVQEMINLVLEAGEKAAKAMELLDTANTSTYGSPELTEVNIGVGDKPGILVSGHDLKDFEELLKQTKYQGIDIYTHSEMLPANYYPEFKKYEHFKGNYGNAWWKQNEEFKSFNGPILMTTNCITPVKDSYKDRIFTTGAAGYPGVEHIPHRSEDGEKDFSKIIELAKTCPPPKEIEKGTITGGFAHNQVLALSDKIVDAVQKGNIKRFIVMAGCDGRHKSRSYYTEVAEKLPEDTVILTAGCAKYRYNKLNLGDINGIPRVLDAGQCNDSYSLAVIALKLKEVFGVEDVNELPISFDIAWYEQKAVAVLLALLHLGFKNIRLGPTLPAFASSTVLNYLVENFDIKPITNAKDDINAMLKGE